MKLLIALFAVIAVCSAAPKWHELEGYAFEDYVKDFGKNYKGDEFHKRKAIFEAELAKIHAHNKDTTKTWKEGVNHLTDLTEAEYRKMLGYNQHYGYNAWKGNGQERVARDAQDFPAEIDWRRDGIVSPVKNQGQCGSCWTFASTETVESLYARKTGQLNVLSEQMILNCVPNPQECGGTGGCQGGTAELAYDTMAKNGTGLPSEWTMPYISYFGNNYPCTYDASKSPIVAKVTGYHKLPSNTYTDLMAAVSEIGPIAISVEAIKWRNYESGVFDGCNQTNPDIDHAVQLVGYGSDFGGSDYWLVRNSWSPAWGDKGYIKIKRTSDEANRCGTDITPADGTGCKGGPATVKVCGTCGILFDSCYPLL